MHMGLGCALENLLIAATANSYTTQLTLLPDASNENLVAQIELTPGSPVPSELYNLIPQRHTNRYPYDTGRTVANSTLDALTTLNDNSDVRILWFNTTETRKTISDLMVEAAKAVVADKTQDTDSAKWYQATWQDVQQHKAGITLDAAGLSDTIRALGKILPSASQEQQDSTFVDNTATQSQTAGAFGLLAIRDGQNRSQQIRAGQVWERIHLWLTREGLAAQPLNATVERAAREVVLGSDPHFGTTLQSLVGDSSWQTLLAFRFGYSTHEGLRSPRRDVNEVMKA